MVNRRMKHISVTKKLWLSVVCIVLGAIIIVGHAGYNSASHQQKFNQQDSLLSQRLDQAAQWSALAQVNTVRTQAALASGSAEDARRFEAQMAQTQSTLQTLIQQLTTTSLDAEQQATVQLTQTLQDTAHSAQQAAEMAQQASGVAQHGGTVVHDVVQTMTDIHQRSQKIADIIGVIDGIAFQTNILALNAAVEAARAGDQGRGFAVVAAEVRSLAQRSAQAAKEIKALIQASVDRIADGAQLAQDAGSTMTEVVQAIQHVTQVMENINHHAAEQRDGVAQVNEAVGSLDQMTQQNAALVEESAAAAHSLRAQSEHLRALVQRFKVQAHDTLPHSLNAPSALGPLPSLAPAMPAPRNTSMSSPQLAQV